MVNYANTTVYGTMLAEDNVFNKNEITEILKNDSKNDWLFDYADKVRKDNVGDEVHLRGLVEFSNICKNSCKYCGLRQGKS